MPQWIESADRVILTLGAEEVYLAESYAVKSSILTQPAQFSLRVGDNDAAVNILKKFPPNTDFRLSVNGVQFQMGRTDSNSVGG